ncbi:MAG TPA: RHS repeat-associated core domain-containing protein [Longimicrobium sp.]|nr:RHS repeat-associated core domain-containing protein [Longimicrobium sp.]
MLALTGSTGGEPVPLHPFGESLSATEQFFNPLRFAAREWDADAHLYYNRARWYDPALHRFNTCRSATRSRVNAA